MTNKFITIKAFPSFKNASTFARADAQRLGTLHTVRRLLSGGFEVCVRFRRVIDDFQNLAMQCGVVARNEDMGALREFCAGYGLSPSSWRFINRHGKAAYAIAVMPSLEVGTQFENALCYIEWQCRAGLEKPLPQALGEKFIISAGMILSLEFDIEPRIARAGMDYWHALENAEGRNAFTESEWVKVLVWMRDEQPRFDRNQWRAGWQAIWRCYQRWEQLKSKKYEWISGVASFLVGNWYVRPLTSSYELALEGMRMKHCVASYTEQCLAGSYRLFSVIERLTNMPVATIGFEKTDGQWHMDQIQGKCNKDPVSEILFIADEINKRFEIANTEVSIQYLPLTDPGKVLEVPKARRKLLENSRYLTTDIRQNLSFSDSGSVTSIPSDPDDWSQNFDDMGPEDWEIIFGGPDY